MRALGNNEAGHKLRTFSPCKRLLVWLLLAFQLQLVLIFIKEGAECVILVMQEAKGDFIPAPKK